jgi:hypothetical protein
MVAGVGVSYSRAEGRVVIAEAEDSEERKETEVLDRELYKFVFEMNLEAFIYYQQYDFTYSLYLLRKCEKVLEVRHRLEGSSSRPPRRRPRCWTIA